MRLSKIRSDALRQIFNLFAIDSRLEVKDDLK